MKVRKWPRAWPTPRLRAMPWPELVWVNTFTRRSLAAYCRAMSRVPSVDPSSTTMTSRARRVEASRLSRHSPM
jgi:hypothetical protein